MIVTIKDLKNVSMSVLKISVTSQSSCLWRTWWCSSDLCEIKIEHAVHLPHCFTASDEKDCTMEFVPHHLTTSKEGVCAVLFSMIRAGILCLTVSDHEERHFVLCDIKRGIVSCAILNHQERQFVRHRFETSIEEICASLSWDIDISKKDTRIRGDTRCMIRRIEACLYHATTVEIKTSTGCMLGLIKLWLYRTTNIGRQNKNKMHDLTIWTATVSYSKCQPPNKYKIYLVTMWNMTWSALSLFSLDAKI